jgi:hypothetical protein
VHFSVIALRALKASNPTATVGMLRLLLLRMHSSGNADALVLSILESLMLLLREKKWGDISILNERKMRAYEAALSAATQEAMGTNVLLTVDEAHELMERRECQHVASLFHSQRDDWAACAGASVSQMTPADSAATRSLFYAVFLELSNLQSVHRWRVYATGTALSMRRVTNSSSASGATRCHPLEFAPAYHLAVPDMVSVLSSSGALTMF